MTGCAGAGRCHTLSSLRSCCPCPPAEPWLAPPSRNRAGPEGNVAPCAAARGRLHDLLSPAWGRAVPRASPYHTHKECRTRSTACEPGTLAASSIPLKGWTHRPTPSYPKGNLSHGRQGFGQAPPSSLHSNPSLEVLQREHGGLET